MVLQCDPGRAGDDEAPFWVLFLILGTLKVLTTMYVPKSWEEITTSLPQYATGYICWDSSLSKRLNFLPARTKQLPIHNSSSLQPRRTMKCKVECQWERKYSQPYSDLTCKPKGPKLKPVCWVRKCWTPKGCIWGLAFCGVRQTMHLFLKAHFLLHSWKTLLNYSSSMRILLESALCTAAWLITD